MENKLKANGESKSVRQLLDTQKYYIDFYQREYVWSKDTVEILLNDILKTKHDNGKRRGWLLPFYGFHHVYE